MAAFCFTSDVISVNALLGSVSGEMTEKKSAGTQLATVVLEISLLPSFVSFSRRSVSCDCICCCTDIECLLYLAGIIWQPSSPQAEQHEYLYKLTVMMILIILITLAIRIITNMKGRAAAEHSVRSALFEVIPSRITLISAIIACLKATYHADPDCGMRSTVSTDFIIQSGHRLLFDRAFISFKQQHWVSRPHAITACFAKNR